MCDVVAQHPESRPEALSRRHLDARFYASVLETLQPLSLQSRGGVVALGVLARHDVQVAVGPDKTVWLSRIAGRSLGAIGAVCLKFMVAEAVVARIEGPVCRVGSALGGGHKVIAPYQRLLRLRRSDRRCAARSATTETHPKSHRRQIPDPLHSAHSNDFRRNRRQLIRRLIQVRLKPHHIQRSPPVEVNHYEGSKAEQGSESRCLKRTDHFKNRTLHFVMQPIRSMYIENGQLSPSPKMRHVRRSPENNRESKRERDHG